MTRKRLERAGIDYTLNGVIPSMKSCQRFAYDDLVSCEVGSEWYQLSYQKCRFCDRGLGDVDSLLKYGVRHYVCEGCAEHYAQMAQPRKG